jgi:hypothetical protein
MARVNFKNVYEDRIKQIEEDITKNVRSKKWTIVAKLGAEKAKLKKRLEEME